MHKEKFHIDFPDETTIENQIQFIVSKGVKPKESFPAYLMNMYKQLGFKSLFRDVTEILYVIIIATAILLFAGLQGFDSSDLSEGRVYSYIFIFSPILFLTIALFFFVNLKNKDTYGVEMTCKYNIYQLAAFRMLVFSGISILVNMTIILSMASVYQQMNIINAFIISLTSLCLFATMFLFAIMKVRSKITKYAVSFTWAIGNLILSIFSTEFYSMLLSNVPVAIYLILTITCMYFYMKNLKNLIVFKSTEGAI